MGKISPGEGWVDGINIIKVQGSSTPRQGLSYIRAEICRFRAVKEMYPGQAITLYSFCIVPQSLRCIMAKP
jgi:hypothetical protein